MNGLAPAAAELWGLCVEDASFTLAIASCLLAAWLLFPALHVSGQWRAALLFLLLAAALIENVWRGARRRPDG